MDTKQLLENCSKAVSLIGEACKVVVLLTLSIFAVIAVLKPAIAKEKLKDAGLAVKEVNLFGVKLAANDAFDAAEAIADAKTTLENYKATLGVTSNQASASIDEALNKLTTATTVLAGQSSKVAAVLKDAGAVLPPLPDDGWVYIGRLADSGTFTPGPRVDPGKTRIQGQRVTALHLRSEAPVVRNGDDCASTRLEDIHPPTSRDLQALQVLLTPNPTTSLDVLATARCPSIGGGQWVYAKVKIHPADVRFTKFENLLNR